MNRKLTRTDVSFTREGEWESDQMSGSGHHTAQERQAQRHSVPALKVFFAEIQT